MTNLDRIRTIVVVCVCVWCGERIALAQTRPPNIVLLVADDLGYGDIGVHGSKDIPTPNIDRLASGGVRFTDAYVTGPYCSPTRAGLLTGRYQQRFGHEFNAGVAGPFGLPLSETTLADRLKAGGYRTALFGKWHLGRGEKFHPMSRGFDEFFGFLGGEHSYLDLAAESNDPILDGRKPASAIPYLTEALADRAVDFIRRHKAGPFLAIRKGDWKLVKTQEGPLPPDPSVLDDLSTAELYDLSADIGETRNLAATNPAKAKELAEEWQRWNRGLAKPLWSPGSATR
jgi:arylsulfatase A-like enzyme